MNVKSTYTKKFPNFTYSYSLWGLKIVSLLSIYSLQLIAQALNFIRVENINLFTISGFIIKFLLAFFSSLLKFLFLPLYTNFMRKTHKV